jgi:hypothetical protein
MRFSEFLMNQKSVVVMPTLKRPEFLALALEKLSETPEANSLDVRIYLDTCSDKRLEEVAFVRDTYLPTAEIFRAGLHVMAVSGCWNILHALKEGYETGAEYVFLVEEDVMVRPNFFQWHYQAQSEDDYFVTCGRRIRQRTTDYFTNPGSCYRRDKLALVMPHIRMEYFADNAGYVEKHFPHMDDAGVLDDGLIRRVMRSVDGKVKCATPSVAVHQGFHYFGHFDRSTTHGTIEERIVQLREMLARISPSDRYTQDFESI